MLECWRGRHKVHRTLSSQTVSNPFKRNVWVESKEDRCDGQRGSTFRGDSLFSSPRCFQLQSLQSAFQLCLPVLCLSSILSATNFRFYALRFTALPHRCNSDICQLFLTQNQKLYLQDLGRTLGRTMFTISQKCRLILCLYWLAYTSKTQLEKCYLPKTCEMHNMNFQ